MPLNRHMTTNSKLVLFTDSWFRRKVAHLGAALKRLGGDTDHGGQQRLTVEKRDTVERRLEKQET